MRIFEEVRPLGVEVTVTTYPAGRDPRGPGSAGPAGVPGPRLERALVRRHDVLLVSSATGRERLEAQGARPERIVPLPDGVDVEAFHPGTTPARSGAGSGSRGSG